MSAAETWRVVLDDGTVASVELRGTGYTGHVARVTGAIGLECARAGRVDAVVAAVLAAYPKREPREIVPPGGATKAEAVAAETDRCADMADRFSAARISTTSGAPQRVASSRHVCHASAALRSSSAARATPAAARRASRSARLRTSHAAQYRIVHPPSGNTAPQSKQVQHRAAVARMFSTSSGPYGGACE